MKFRTIIIRALIGLFLIGALAQCGGKTQSSEVTISLAQGQPIVFTGGGPTVNSVQIQGPWFNFQVNIANNSDEPLTLEAVSIIVTLINGTAGPGGNSGSSGGSSGPSTEITFTPSQQDTSNADVTCDYDGYFTTINAGSSATLSAPNTESTPPSSCPDPVTPIVFYAGGLPNVSNAPVSFVPIYQVEVIPQGWFGTATSAEDRFNGFAYFTTR